MTWTTLSFAFGSTLTSTKMTQLYDNLTALANGDSGSPSIQSAALASSIITQAKMSSAAIGQSQTKTTTAPGTIVLSDGSSGDYPLTGATYSMWTAASNFVSGSAVVGFGNGHTGAGTIGFARNSGTGSDVTIYVDERYFQASPPYRHGPLFAFLLINPDKTYGGIRIMPDPPWAYHGPTDIRGEFVGADGKWYTRVPSVNNVPLRAAMLQDRLLAAKVAAGQIAVDTVIHEITPEYKDSDMALIPHPFLSVKPGQTVVLLEPGTSIMQRFSDMCDLSVGREIIDIIEKGYLRIDNSPILVPNTPPGVQVCRSSWKLT